MADYKLSEGTAAEPLSGGELMEVSQETSPGVYETRVTTAGAVAALAGGGGTATVTSEAGTALLADGTSAGRYTRFTNAGSKAYTFDSGEAYAVGAEYHGRNVGVGDLALVGTGSFTLNAPAGGTLVVPQGGTFTVKIVGTAEADVFGVTVAE